MHLAVFSGDRPVFFEYHGSVVVQAGSATFEQRSDEYDAAFTGQRSVEICLIAGNGYGKTAEVYIFSLAEVERVVEFLVDDKFGSVGGQTTDFIGQTAAVVFYIGAVCLLNDTCSQYFHSQYFLKSSKPLGSCIVAQWSDPCWRISALQSMGITS